MVPVEFVVLFAVAHEPDPLRSPPFVAAATIRIAAALVAVVGLDSLYRALERRGASVVRAVGVTGAAIAILANVAGLAAIDTSAVDIPVLLVSNLLIAAWFIGSGAILMREGGALARIGWTAELGGVGMVLTGIAIAIPFGGTLGETGTSLNDWFRILGLFVIVYLVRIWRYVVGGRLPGPGIL
jgi:hypothetical protein